MNSHTMHFHHSNWFPIVRHCWIYIYHEQSEKIFGQVGPELNTMKYYNSTDFSGGGRAVSETTAFPTQYNIDRYKMVLKHSNKYMVTNTATKES